MAAPYNHPYTTASPIDLTLPSFLTNGAPSYPLAGPSTAGPSVIRPPARPHPPSAPQVSYTASSTLTTQSPGSSRSQESPPHAGPGTSIVPYVEPHQDLQSFLESFWGRQIQETEEREEDFKGFGLPLARIKKVMKSDEEVKMISAEAPVMFSKACEIFISELTCRAWLVAESHKRRTLQKSDVAEAIGLSDMFDFLIDIVPREEEGEGHDKSYEHVMGHEDFNGGEEHLEEDNDGAEGRD